MFIAVWVSPALEWLICRWRPHVFQMSTDFYSLLIDRFCWVIWYHSLEDLAKNIWIVWKRLVCILIKLCIKKLLGGAKCSKKQILLHKWLNQDWREYFLSTLFCMRFTCLFISENRIANQWPIGVTMQRFFLGGGGWGGVTRGTYHSGFINTVHFKPLQMPIVSWTGWSSFVHGHTKNQKLQMFEWIRRHLMRIDWQVVACQCIVHKSQFVFDNYWKRNSPE